MGTGGVMSQWCNRLSKNSRFFDYLQVRSTVLKQEEKEVS